MSLWTSFDALKREVTALMVPAATVCPYSDIVALEVALRDVAFDVGEVQGDESEKDGQIEELQEMLKEARFVAKRAIEVLGDTVESLPEEEEALIFQIRNVSEHLDELEWEIAQ